MKDSKNEKTVKSNRQRYFHMIINLGSIVPKINLSTMHITSLVDLLLTSNFASQKILETILYSLRITDRGRLISIKNFDGQLERDSRGVGILFNYCFGKAGAVSIECALWFGFSVAGGVTCNPALIYLMT